MLKFYQKIKGMLANPNMFHVLYTYLLTNVYADLFQLVDTYDKLLVILGSGALGIVTGVFIESMDGRVGTKQLDETGVPGNEFSVKDLMYDIVGAVLAMVTIWIMIA